MLLDKLRQKAAERKTREAQRRAGSATGARARLLEVEDPKPVPPPSGTFRTPPPPPRTDAPYSDRYQDSRREYVEVEVEDVVALTARAALCLIDGEQHWLPLSEMYEPGNVFDKRGQQGTVYLPEWLATEKGLG